MMRIVLGAVVLLTLAGSARAQGKTLEIRVTGGKTAATHVPITVPLSLPEDWTKNKDIALSSPGEERIVGQLTKPGLLTEEIAPSDKMLVRHDLHFVLPKLDAGQTVVLKAEFDSKIPVKGGFSWSDESLHAELRHGAQPVLRLVNNPYNDASKEAREKSYKVFHHLYDPAGKLVVTNGGQTDPDAAGKKLTFPHHRGLMYGFNKITYDGNKKADTWHCTNDAHVAYVKTLDQEAGAVLGRQRVLLDWYGSKTDVFAKEERELTVYNVPGGTLVEFASRLKTTDGKVKLDGDPQHAGFQFRASQEVADKSAKETYFIEPNRQGKPGETHNWSEKQPDGMVDLPWYVMSFVLRGQRYSVCLMNNPLNPHPTRFSERDYGRFGGYFEYELTKERPLTVDYRVWLQDGELSAGRAAALASEFTAPPKAEVVQR